MIKYHTNDKINQKSKIELSAQNNSIHNLSHHTASSMHAAAVGRTPRHCFTATFDSSWAGLPEHPLAVAQDGRYARVAARSLARRAVSVRDVARRRLGLYPSSTF